MTIFFGKSTNIFFIFHFKIYSIINKLLEVIISYLSWPYCSILDLRKFSEGTWVINKNVSHTISFIIIHLLGDLVGKGTLKVPTNF